MGLQRKLEKIRQKPEHIKRRYTYIAVIISMFFILLLWFFSLADTIEKADLIRKQNVFEESRTQKKSLKDATDDIKKSLTDLNSNTEKTAPADTDITPENIPTAPIDIPQKTEDSLDNNQLPLSESRPLPKK